MRPLFLFLFSCGFLVILVIPSLALAANNSSAERSVLVNSVRIQTEGGGGPGPGCSDSDYDGVCNSNDNCPTIYNPNQSDLDGDRIGDVCDSDDDIDGILDTVDNCVGNYNPLQEDWDDNGIGDQCDIFIPPAVASSCVSGPGPFSYATPLDSYQISGAVPAIAKGDLDADGNIDVVSMVVGSTSLKYLKNDVEGTADFVVEDLQIGVSGIQSNGTLQVAALDAIGGDDIVLWPGFNGTCTSNSNCKRLYILKNYNPVPSGNDFSSVVYYTLGSKPGSIAVGDLDGDSDNDIVTGNYGDDTLSILINDGNGVFTLQPSISFNVSPFPIGNSETIRNVVLGDLDCDSDLDIVVSFVDALSGSGLVRVLTNQRFPNPAAPISGGGIISLHLDETYGSAHGLGTNPVALALGDTEQWDGLSDQDIVVGSSVATGGQVVVTIIYNDRCGGPSPQARSYVVGYDNGVPSTCATETCLTHRAYALSIGDYDVDGDNDIVITSGSETNGSDAPKTTFLFNNGFGQFSVPPPQSVCMTQSEDSRPVLSADLNGDGALDIIVGDFSSGVGGVSDITVILNQTSPPGNGDCDMDGDVDLYDFSIFQNCFTGPDNGPVAPTCQCSDIDSDSDVDLDDYYMFGETMNGPGPEAPNALMTSTVASFGVTLEWSDNSLIEDFYIVVKEGNGGSEEIVLPRNANTFTDLEVLGNETITYRVYAANEWARSADSNTLQVNVPGPSATIQEIPLPSGSTVYSWTQGNALNDQGDAVGYMHHTISGGGYHGFIWRDNNGNGVIQALPQYWSAIDINNFGAYLATSITQNAATRILVNPSGVATQLIGPNGSSVGAQRLNDLGQVLAMGAVGGVSQALVYESNTSQWNLIDQTIRTYIVGATDSFGSDLNNQGLVVGSVDTSSARKGFIVDTKSVLSSPQVMQFNAPVGYEEYDVVPHAIADLPPNATLDDVVIVGWITHTGAPCGPVGCTTTEFPVVWQGNSAMNGYQGGFVPQIIGAGSSGCFFSSGYPVDVNAHRQIVANGVCAGAGAALLIGQNQQGSWVIKHSLLDLLAPGSESWVSVHSTRVNNQGQVLGFGYVQDGGNYVPRAFLLSLQ